MGYQHILSLIPAIGPKGLRREFWDTDIVNGSTINFITPPDTGPVPFSIIIFSIAALIFLAALLAKRDFSPGAMKRIGILSFLAAWTLFAFRMDYNWAAMLKYDLLKFGFGNTDSRIAFEIGSDLKEFMDFVRKTIPEGETAREIKIDQYDPAYTFTRHGNYHLLPMITSKNGKYVWVYDFTTADYEPETNLLTVFGEKFKARPFAVFRQGAYIFEIMEEL